MGILEQAEEIASKTWEIIDQEEESRLRIINHLYPLRQVNHAVYEATIKRYSPIDRFVLSQTASDEIIALNAKIAKVATSFRKPLSPIMDISVADHHRLITGWQQAIADFSRISQDLDPFK